ncbi:MAG: hypothetical protein CMF28_03445 [Kiritimatiellaceae bacterium]|nr:hypothetical protein [Kiritimatiellaceae bacterium]
MVALFAELIDKGNVVFVLSRCEFEVDLVFSREEKPFFKSRLWGVLLAEIGGEFCDGLVELARSELRIKVLHAKFYVMGSLFELFLERDGRICCFLVFFFGCLESGG